MTALTMSDAGILADEWLLSYAAGALNEAQALVVATHADCHPDLTDKVMQAEDIGGGLLDTLAPSALDDDALDRVMAALDADPRAETPPAPAAPTGRASDLPAPLAQYLGKDLVDLDWRTMGPGMQQVKLWSGPKGEKLWLLKAKGGTAIPAHDHRGSELTLVLRGSYYVGDQHFTPGLVEYADTDIDNHRPVIDEGEDCICLVATEAPIRLHSLVARLVQPFIGL